MQNAAGYELKNMSSDKTIVSIISRAITDHTGFVQWDGRTPLFHQRPAGVGNLQENFGPGERPIHVDFLGRNSDDEWLFNVVTWCCPNILPFDWSELHEANLVDVIERRVVSQCLLADKVRIIGSMVDRREDLTKEFIVHVACDGPTT